MNYYFWQITSWMNLGFPVSISRIKMLLFAWLLGLLHASAASEHWNSFTGCILWALLLFFFFQNTLQDLKPFLHFCSLPNCLFSINTKLPFCIQTSPTKNASVFFCKTLYSFGYHVNISFINVMATVRQYVLEGTHIAYIFVFYMIIRLHIAVNHMMCSTNKYRADSINKMITKE